SIKPGAEEIVVEDFGKLIAHARQKAGLKQDELALKINEKLPVVQAAESGRRLDIMLARKLAKFFGIKLVEVV
ncbi:MAG: helix-turn-helix domain-containing protein, partial [archaeon]